ncbi:TonB-dependent receptor [Chitinophaga nivalis]|uniref:TonB-dependent receptor n=1 Tax=Chitinophaga nivalis TaxID=2991709 RepID=A0ABT3IQ78_9BACT|nr:TonB-dependent receptor [Chitinophaga nivalis]MCW3464204.1 TonB-dependent receptor [Chitinophaga nivalis]MCW3486106.1 TonB-dependent receptor [Chitinophaga nivalis]
MQNKGILLMACLCLLGNFGIAQSKPVADFEGIIKDEKGAAIEAVIYIRENGKGTVASSTGVFSYKALPPGHYTLEIRAVGYKSLIQQIDLPLTTATPLTFQLRKKESQLSAVTVWGRSATEAVNKQSYNVVAIDAKKLYNTTLDIGQVMNRVSGARVRETGGVGSDVSFSLNGFTGKQVKFFVDGMPMDNFGSSFQLNNIPVNFAERVEIYKGVVPVWLGGDALGGAVNIVTNTTPRTYLDVSYSYGSFNTHKSAINAGYTANSGFTLQLNAFQNYSDNNYWVDVDVANLKSGVNTPMRVRRFHDRYRNETVVANVGVGNKKWADQLLFGITLGQNKADIQTGNRMYEVFGGRERKGNIIQPSVKYTKTNLFVKGLDLRIHGKYNLGEERAIDTLFRQYNWLGDWQYKDRNNPDAIGGELSRMDYTYRNNNGIGNVNLSYKINNKHAVTLNDVITTFNRKGQNKFDPDNIANKQPKKTLKNILGLGYRLDLNERWNTSVFMKHYYQLSESSDYMDGVYYHSRGTVSKFGYGLASTYFLLPALQVKASYEKAYRLPDNDELFGDVVNLTGNPDLKPESSDNINIGVNYSFAVHTDHHFSVDGNFIFRNAKDYIRNQLQPVRFDGFAAMMPVNTRDVTNRGVDGEIRYSYRNIFTAGVNATYQNLRNNTRIEPGKTEESDVYRDRIPNMPYFFGNANASISFKNVGWKNTLLTVGYNLLYVREFYLRWPSKGDKDTKNIIPEQLAHDMSIVYALANGKYNIAVEGSNLTDRTLYDNFSLQKPGRAFHVKFRYFFIKNQAH